jgi:hypothetical protein
MDTRLSCREAGPLIWERAAGDLAPEEARALEAHLAGCDRCREESRAAARAFELLATLDRPVAPRPNGWDRLYRRIRAPVAPLWRRVTAPALSSAAATAVVLALAIGRIAMVSPGPGEVVVLARGSQPTSQPDVKVLGEEGFVVASRSWLDDNLALGLPKAKQPAPVSVADAGTAAIAKAGSHTKSWRRSASTAGSRRPRRSGPVEFNYKPVVIPAGAVSRATPTAPVVVKPKPPAEEPVVHYTVDYSGDIVGRPVGGTGT